MLDIDAVVNFCAGSPAAFDAGLPLENSNSVLVCLTLFVPHGEILRSRAATAVQSEHLLETITTLMGIAVMGIENFRYILSKFEVMLSF